MSWLSWRTNFTISGHRTLGGSFPGCSEELDIVQGDIEQMLFREGKLVVGRLFTFRNLHTRIVARKVLQNVKDVLRVGVNRARNFLRCFSGSGRKFSAHVVLQL